MAFQLETQQAPEARYACTLAPEELEDRLSAWRSLRSEALLEERVGDGVAHALFRRSEQTGQQLRALIEAEKRCCAFLEFALREEGDVIEVEIRAPAGVESVIGGGSF
jgi:hypothetical protein